VPRDLRLDLLRGFCIVVMTVDHVGGESSWFYAITGANRQIVSAAEVFVLLSGFVMGMVHRGVVQRRGIGAMLGKVIRRSLVLYGVTVLLTIAFAAASVTLGVPWAQRAAPSASPEDFVFAVLTFQRTYSLADILVLYTLLALVAGPALWLAARGYTLVVIVLTWTFWIAYQLSPERVPRAWDIADGGFPLAAWQVLFCTGLVLGFHRDRLAPYFHPTRLVGFAVAAAAALTALYVTTPLWVADQVAAAPVAYQLLFDKYNVRVGRVFAVLIFVALAYAALTMAWSALRPRVGWLLLTLGRRPLLAFGVQMFAVALMCSQLMAPLRLDHANELFQGAAVAIVWLACLGQPRPVTRALTELMGAARRTFAAAAQASVVVLAPVMAIVLVVALTEGSIPLGPGHAGTPQTETASTAVASLQYGRVEERSFHSEALARTMPLMAYLPPTYDADAPALFPVLYMLHGEGGSSHDWVDYGLLETADLLIGSGVIPPLLVILAHSDQGEWLDPVGDPLSGMNSERWGSYVARDVVTQVDQWYRTVASPEGRAIGGVSSGGYGAMLLPLTFENVWSALGAHSPSPRALGGASLDRGEREESAADAATAISSKAALAAQYRWWIDASDVDPHRDAATTLHDSLTALGIAHEWRVYPGSRSADDWSVRTVDYLTYYANALCGATLACR
jgi:enterochelin esterase-like enzyme